MDNLSLYQTSPGVFYSRAPLVAVDNAIISMLKEEAAISPLKRARLCAHPDPAASQHDMVIVSHRDTYVPPHRHLEKTETMLVLEGRADAILFDEDGAITRVLPMGPQQSGRVFFYRMPERVFHSLIIYDEWLIFTESTTGPFSADASQTASWAPGTHDLVRGQEYKLKILETLRQRAG